MSAPELPRVYRAIREAGVSAWQIQLTVPMGNAADRATILMQPAELVDLYDVLARITRVEEEELETDEMFLLPAESDVSDNP